MLGILPPSHPHPNSSVGVWGGKLCSTPPSLAARGELPRCKVKDSPLRGGTCARPPTWGGGVGGHWGQVSWGPWSWLGSVVPCKPGSHGGWGLAWGQYHPQAVEFWRVKSLFMEQEWKGLRTASRDKRGLKTGHFISVEETDVKVTQAG